jgi:hypothetical protein
MPIALRFNNSQQKPVGRVHRVRLRELHHVEHFGQDRQLPRAERDKVAVVADRSLMVMPLSTVAELLLLLCMWPLENWRTSQALRVATILAQLLPATEKTFRDRREQHRRGAENRMQGRKRRQRKKSGSASGDMGSKASLAWGCYRALRVGGCFTKRKRCCARRESGSEMRCAAFAAASRDLLRILRHPGMGGKMREDVKSCGGDRQPGLRSG